MLCGGISAAGAGHAAVIHDHKIDGRDFAIFFHAHPYPALHAGACGTDIEFLLARNSQLQRPIESLGEIARDRHIGVGANLGAETATGCLIDKYEIGGIDVKHTRETIVVGTLALRRAVEIAFAVFPIRHTGARFERVVRVADSDERLFDNGRSFSKARIEVAKCPLCCELSPCGFFARTERIDCRLWPFDIANFGAAYRCALWAFLLRSH